MEMTMTCAEESRAAEETLAGTFKPADTFFLIQTSLAEYGGWGGEIVKKAGASGGFAPYLQHLMRAPRAKILFIRRPASDGKNFYVAVTNQGQPRIYHTILTDYDELLTLDLDSIGEDRCPRVNDYDMHDEGELYTVCTNGRHDPCCAALGTPFYQALIEHAGEDKVWQTSHIGGHRMAATMIAFSTGHRLRTSGPLGCRSGRDQSPRWLPDDAQVSRARRLRGSPPGRRRASSGWRGRGVHPGSGRGSMPMLICACRK